MLLISAVVTGVLAWSFRGQIVGLVDAAADVAERTSVWSQVGDLVAQQPVLGWGWAGIWPPEVFPFSSVLTVSGADPGSALNAYADIWLQLGLAGIIVLLVALGLAFVRAWLVASRRKSTVYVWPALTLVLLATVSMTESYLLFEGGLLLFVTSAFAASRSGSWRGRFD